MLDFLMVTQRNPKRGVIEIYPKFMIPTIKSSSDLMIRGRDFYAIWNEEEKLWSTSEEVALYLIDREVDKYAEEHKNDFEDARVKILHMGDAENGLIDRWHKFVTKQMRDHYHELDSNVVFSNDIRTKDLYVSKYLPYPLKKGEHKAYDEMMSVLYSPEELKKIEWAIGSIVTGESKYIQKFLVLYGAPKTGKSTILNIIQSMFKGYYSVFDAKALGSASAVFALEAFKDNPLLAIQHDADLSRIEDNTRLNSIVSHETMLINEKNKPQYAARFNSMLLIGTNKPVKITDAKSGILRRLIDVSPTGNRLPAAKYKELYSQIEFELGAIAYHCKQVYKKNRDLYDDYVPMSMMSASNDFYNYMLEYYDTYLREDQVTLSIAWERYNKFVTDARVLYPFSRRNFQEELKNYFREFYERTTDENGNRIRSVYKGFMREKFEVDKKQEDAPKSWLTFSRQHSLLDDILADCPAQMANESGVPSRKWSNCNTTLKDIDTTGLHYVLINDLSHIVIDFDIKDEEGKKCYEKNLEAASKWPPTYAELSKSGAGIHLHYIYAGDPSTLSEIYAEDIEIKVFSGNSSLRRKLTMCNDIPIATISSGLPLKEVKKSVLTKKTIKDETDLRRRIQDNLEKKIHADTSSSINFIKKILDEAYESGMPYDVSDMEDILWAFASQSSNQKDRCQKVVLSLHLKSAPAMPNVEDYSDDTIIFFDVEVFPNLFVVNWKFDGPEHKVVRMLNPPPEDIDKLIEFKLVGFNCRRYDNHMLYAWILGYTNEQLYYLSQSIIMKGKGFFGAAYNISYTDIFDFSSKKQSLKKWEIEIGKHHQELGLPWDQPVPEELWTKVAEYCDNDVLSTEALWHWPSIQADWTARQILAKLAGMNVNDTTNSLTQRIIFGRDRSPQSKFNYRNLGDTTAIDHIMFNDEYSAFDKKDRPIFPGYVFVGGKSSYRDEDPKEGGYVYAEPGYYEDLALLDIASMHPSSAIAEVLFGEEYTKRFKELKEVRVMVKHKDYDAARKMLDGALTEFLDDPNLSSKNLAQALKIAINAVYGQTAAKYDNPFRDPRNIDNIVAKRGALFMINLKHLVQERNRTVAHIKTDSIKIPNADHDIISFVMEYGKAYGYTFEHEATYSKMCLVNDAVYIAKYADGEHEFELPTGEKVMTAWTATGTQFQVPYVFKTLFSHNDINFRDLCETKEVKEGEIYIDMNEDLPEGEHNYIFVGRVGAFCPIKPGRGGGLLYRYKDGKYYAVTGTKGYRWLESEVVKNLGKEDDIDISYYDKLADAAKATIEEYCSYEQFVAD